MKPTQVQEKAITTRGDDILVAASAGTGKTTVLSQRVAHLVADGGEPLSRILAVTFTDAAATDMRKKIAAELRARVEAASTPHLERQLFLVDRAAIGTLHSFCLRLLRAHFHLTGLDPGFRVLDPQEAELLRDQVAGRMLDDWFDRADANSSGFLELVDAHGGRGGEKLVGRLLRLHAFIATLPEPEEWRNQVRAAYADPSQIVWQNSWQSAVRHALARIDAFAEAAEAITSGKPVLAKYAEFFRDLRDVFRGWRERATPTEEDWDQLLATIREYAWPGFPKVRGLNEDPDKLAASDLKDKLKKQLETLQSGFAAQSTLEVRDDLRSVGPRVCLFLRLEEELSERYQKAKRDQASVDFNDLERMTYRLLCDHAAAAEAIRDQYRYQLVDECQDINPLQDAILERLAGDGARRVSERFLVGDVKQSIYGFRLAAPELFLDRYERYSQASSSGVCIPLNENFRCRPGILDAVNFVFERIATAELGNPYGPDARLVAGFSYPDCAEVAGAPTVELDLLEKTNSNQSSNETEANDDPADEDLADASDIEREGIRIVERIQRLVGRLPVFDPKSNEYRPARYRDMVILLRSMKGRGDQLTALFDQAGIPYFAEQSSGFFAATEVSDVVSLLKLLDNPRQDVPMAAVLRSPLLLGPLCPDELARLRLSSPGPFAEAVFRYASAGPAGPLRDKVQAIWTRIEQWRRAVREQPLARVLWEIYRETHALAYAEGLDAGRARRANLIQLHDLARQFDQFHQQGLFRFLRFLERLRDADQDTGPAPVLSEADDVVRILTIHKSKGLEFPIVFLPDLGKRFNQRDLYDEVLFHRRELMATDRVDLDQRLRHSTLPGLVIAHARGMELRAEEQRLLYVGMTRARERLFLSATVTAKSLTSARVQLSNSARTIQAASANCMSDWLLGLAAPVWAGDLAPDALPFTVHWHDAATIAAWKVNAERAVKDDGLFADLAKLAPIGVAQEPERDAEVRRLCARLEWIDPRARFTRLPGKISATNLKKRLEISQTPSSFNARERRFFRRPQWIPETSSQLSALDKGTATHAVLEHLDLDGSLDEGAISGQVAALVERQILSSPLAALIDVPSLARFFERPLGRRLRAANWRLREAPFSILIPASEIPSLGDAADIGAECGPAGSDSPRDACMVQGKIDCFFQEGDRVVVIDYKTDQIDPVDARVAAETYRPQVDLYRRAVDALLKPAEIEIHLAFLFAGADVRLADASLTSALG